MRHFVGLSLAFGMLRDPRNDGKLLQVGIETSLEHYRFVNLWIGFRVRQEVGT